MQFVFNSPETKGVPKEPCILIFWFTAIAMSKQNKTTTNTVVTSVPVRYSMDMCDRKVSACTGKHINAFMFLRLF